MHYRVLGPLEVVDAAGAAWPIASPSQRAVLATLLVRRPAVVPVDVLVDAVWGDDAPRSAVPTVRTYVSRLRRVVGDDLVGTDAGYRLDVPDDAVDAARFEAALRVAAVEAAPGRVVELLDAALASWRGPAYGDVADLVTVRADALRLEELRLAAREQRAAALVEAGDAARAVAEAESLVADHPLREGAWTTLVRGLTASARPAEALRAVARAAAALGDAGLEPSDGLRRAEREALGLEAPPNPPATARRPAPGRIPRPASSFVGRDDLLARCLDLVLRHRCVTLTGPGGVGKTRLAVEVAAAAAPRFELGAVLVELGDVDDPVDVPDAVVAALGLGGTGSAGERLARAGDLAVLLVVDNAEHVLEAVAEVVATVSRSGDSCHVVVTSQERLGVDGEQVCVVAPLAPDGAAQALFRDRVAATGVPVDAAADTADVDRIVARLDGLPLAIEMAAAAASTLTFAELGDLLERDLGGLASSRRDVASRHRSMRALLDWSIGRLDERERRTLHELTVFAGWAAATDVAGVLGDDAVPVVRRLAERSLLAVRRDGSAARFAPWTAVRSHLTERWGDVPDAVRARYVGWFVQQADDAARRLISSDEAAQSRRLTAMLPELRAVHRWATSHDRASALALTASLHPYAQMGLVDEVLGWAEPLVAEPRPGDDPGRLAVAMASAATRWLNRGQHAAAVELARRALAVAPDDRAALPALEAIADASLYDGRLDESARAYEELLRRARRCGVPWYETMGSTGLGLVAAYSGSDAPPEVGDEDDVTLAPTARALIAYTKAELAGDDPARASRLYDRALELAAMAPGSLVQGVARVSASALRARSGDLREAIAFFRDAIAHWLRVADLSHQVTTLRNLVVLLRRLGLAGEAAELIGSVDDVGVPTYGAEAERLDAARRWVVDVLGADASADLVARGAGRGVAETARWALDVLDRAAASAAGQPGAGRLADHAAPRA